ncbi:TIR-like protein DUF1863 [Kribbella orskensis]|uniref:TIR-like protein DUF1863 n=1 Tax=Kribbella orskensis TaxID=2512216 RepID=A0ABY2BR37_9ACTN|nr:MULTISPECIES: TIR domain-containing protein [Kribbella]TCN28164.1 TIR-like protein DUF1863 [Kribbella sp. VKM Ac-2500]TCO27960.1 TIR-like protein DUF1863 [Kribbella orskensis]
MAKSAFFSFYYQRDNWRVQQVMKMGAVEGQPLLNSQDWETVEKQGPKAVENWIEKQMKYKSAVVVLVGAQTAKRPWVKYEITKAWNERRPLVGIRIHGLADVNSKTDFLGPNPFNEVGLQGGGTVGSYVTLHDPVGSNSQAVYASIKNNIGSWVDNAYKRS